MKIDASIAVRAVRHANGGGADPGVCTPSIARYTGASGSLYIPSLDKSHDYRFVTLTPCDS